LNLQAGLYYVDIKENANARSYHGGRQRHPLLAQESGEKPKHLLDIVSSRTIIQETVDRIKPLIDPKNILVVTGRKHARELIRQLPEASAKNIIIEPVGRNTAACIGLAALHIQRKTKDAILICKRGRSQDVKKIVDALEAKKLKKYL
jgi:mannose-1-phosphate guanylyltransferase